jgi:UDP-N-acetylglucosamine 2-epimerase (non-hydrolysing)
MKIVTVIGARPQFIKAAPVCRAIQGYNLKNSNNQIIEFIVHTGQHYDHEMSQIFFDEMQIPEPNINLGVGPGNHGQQTGQMLMHIEEVLLVEKPDWVVVYGDTNSTLAGALAAVKLHIPVAHVEAGLRSFNREMPEEHNRILTDHCSDLLFCPTQTAVNNLASEGIFDQDEKNSSLTPNNRALPLTSHLKRRVVLVGDTMYDAVLRYRAIAGQHSTILQDLGLKKKSYILATVHRPYNTDMPENLQNILSAFLNINDKIVFPVHPRTRQKLQSLSVFTFTQGRTQQLNNAEAYELKNIIITDPVGYMDMLVLEENARLILTDSGGMQKEAYFMGIPCVTLRPETEWIETVEAGWNVVVGANREKIIDAANLFKPPDKRPNLYGDGRAGERVLENFLLAKQELERVV